MRASMTSVFSQFRRIALASLALSLIGITGNARAGFITVPNYSFETPVYGPGGFGVIGSPWSVTGFAGGLDGAYATPTDGNQTAFVGTDNPQASSIYQDVIPLQPSMLYTLYADVIPRAGFVGSQGAIQLYNGTDPTGTLLASTPVVETATTYTATTSYLTGPTVTGDLTIVLAYDNAVNGQMIYDNVRLTALPEPGSISVMGLCAFGLFSRHARTRAV